MPSDETRRLLKLFAVAVTDLGLKNTHNAGKPGSFKPGQNSHTGEAFRRGPDRIPRGTVRSIFQTLLDDDGTLGDAVDLVGPDRATTAARDAPPVQEKDVRQPLADGPRAHAHHGAATCRQNALARRWAGCRGQPYGSAMTSGSRPGSFADPSYSEDDERVKQPAASLGRHGQL